MSLHLSGLRVFVPSTDTAPLVAERLREGGAKPLVGEISSFLTDDATAEHPVALAVVPADASEDVAEAVIDRAQELHIPVDDQRGGAARQTFRGERGTVTLVGGGPGDPDLITVAGARAIAEADVILADHLGPFALAEDAAARGAEIIDVSKLPYGRQVAQERTNELLVEHSRAGRNVVRLKGGDPFVFGRGFEEWQHLANAGVPVKVIPGVTSATSAPAVAGFSITHRGLNHDITFVSGHVPPGHPKSQTDWSAVAQMRGTIILIMAVKNAPAIAESLMNTQGGQKPETPVAVIENASTIKERVVTTTLGDLGATMESEDVRPPAIILIGEAAGRRMR